MQQLIAGELSRNRSSEVQTTLLDAIAESNLKAAPATWGEAVAVALQDPNSAVAHAGIRAARAITSTNKIDPAIEKIVLRAANDSGKSDDLRLELVSLLPARSTLSIPLFFVTPSAISTRLQSSHAANQCRLGGGSREFD